MRSAKGVADTLDDGQELDSELDSEPAEDSGTVQHGTTRAGDGSQAKAEAAADSEPPPPPPPKWARSCGGSGCPPGGWEYYFTGRGYEDERGVSGGGDGGGGGSEDETSDGDGNILDGSYTGPRDRAWARRVLGLSGRAGLRGSKGGGGDGSVYGIGVLERREDDMAEMGFEQNEVEEASWRRVVRLAYLSLAKLHHPDKVAVHNSGNADREDDVASKELAAKERFQMIQEAFDLLMS